MRSAPVRNLYYLFCYAWARFPKVSAVPVGINGLPDIANLFAKILVSELHRLTRRGLAQGYVTDDLEVRSLAAASILMHQSKRKLPSVGC